MSDSSLTSPSPAPAPSQGEIDASCRLPLLALFPGAALWLLLAAVAMLLGSMSFHKPDMFADKAWLSYGRILPFAKTLLVYGFCLPAGYGIALWIAARLGRTRLAGSVMATIAAKLWHLGVFIGSFGILCGASTGNEGFEMPHYAAFMVLLAALLLGYVGLLTIHYRTGREMYPSLWYIITGFLWFPWVMSTAIVLLGCSPVRGLAQASVLAWFVNNVQFVTLGLFGIGAALYFLPKLSGKPLYSKYYAGFALLALVLFSSWAGIPGGGPFPAWMGTISSVASLFAVLVVIAHMGNTCRSCCFKAPGAEAKFFSFSTGLLTLAVVVGAVGAFVHQTHFTLFPAAQHVLLVQGFFGLIALGGIYHILPKVAGLKWPLAGLVRLHFVVALLGVLLIALPFIFGGWGQGVKLKDASVSFVEIAKGTLMPIRMASMGELLWILGSLFFAANVFLLVYQWVRSVVKPLVTEAIAPITAAEVKG